MTRRHLGPASPSGAAAVFRKELVDALRDRRTLATVLLSSVLMGPLVLLLLSSLVASLESRAEQRVVVVQARAGSRALTRTADPFRPGSPTREPFLCPHPPSRNQT